jgi:hypothetical protein
MLHLLSTTKTYLNNQEWTELICISFRSDHPPYTNVKGLYNNEDDLKSLKEQVFSSLPILMACKS